LPATFGLAPYGEPIVFQAWRHTLWLFVSGALARFSVREQQQYIKNQHLASIEIKNTRYGFLRIECFLKKIKA
jgi:hypothetical protein